MSNEEKKARCYVIKIDAEGLFHHQAIADQDDMKILDEVLEKIRRNALAAFASSLEQTGNSGELGLAGDPPGQCCESSPETGSGLFANVPKPNPTSDAKAILQECADVLGELNEAFRVDGSLQRKDQKEAARRLDSMLNKLKNEHRTSPSIYGENAQIPDFLNMPIEQVDEYLRSEGIDPDEERKYGLAVVARIGREMAARSLPQPPSTNTDK